MTDSNHAFNIAFNQKWAGDIGDIWTNEGWLYLAVVLDLYSRRVIGRVPSHRYCLPTAGQWCSNRMKRDLAIRTLDIAVALPQPPEGYIHHTDRGSQYCSNEYQRRLSKVEDRHACRHKRALDIRTVVEILQPNFLCKNSVWYNL